MKSVAVLGDVRLHLIRLERSKDFSESPGPLGETRDVRDKLIAGGAKMMAEAIDAVASSLATGTLEVISYDGEPWDWLVEKRKKESLAADSWRDGWTLKKTHIAGAKPEPRLRLMEPVNMPEASSCPLKFPGKLRDSKVVEELWAVVIDDLNLGFRDAVFAGKDGGKDRRGNNLDGSDQYSAGTTR
jgi:hypothetical protein